MINDFCELIQLICPFNIKTKMQESGPNPVTISLPFIFLKQKGVSSAPVKKIVFPSSYDELLKLANKVYQKSMCVKSLYNDSGIQINSVDLIVPGSIVYASSVDPEINETFQEMVEKRTPKSEKKPKVKNTKSYLSLFGMNPDNAPLAKKENESGTPRRPMNTGVKFTPRNDINNRKRINLQKNIPAKAQENDDQSYSENEHIENKIEDTKDKIIDLGDIDSHIPIIEISENYSDIEDQKENSQASISDSAINEQKQKSILKNNRASKISKKKVPVQKKRKVSINEEKKYVQEIDEEDNNNKSKNGNENQNINENSSNISAPVTFLEANSSVFSSEKCSINHEEFGDNETPTSLLMCDMLGITNCSHIQEAICILPPKIPSLMNTMIGIEFEQAKSWFSRGLSLMSFIGLSGIQETYVGNSDSVQKTRNFIRDHRYSFGQWQSVSMNTIVTGPKKSGKSTLLHVLIEQLLIELVSSGCWKKDLFVFFEPKELISSQSNPIDFYETVITSIFRSLEWYRPDIEPLLSQIKKALLFVTTAKNLPSFPKSLAQDQRFTSIVLSLQQIVNRLYKLIQNDESFVDWIKSVLSLPQEISSIFGYRQVIFVCDDFDTLLVKMKPNPPFDKSSTSLILSDILMEVFYSNSYIISCKEQTKLLEILSNIAPRKNSGPIIIQSELLSTLGIISGFEYKEYMFSLSLENINGQFNLNSKHLDGIAPYVDLWTRMNYYYDLFMQAQEINDLEKIEEYKLELLSYTQELIDRMFIDPQDPSNHVVVESVKRSQSKTV